MTRVSILLTAALAAALTGCAALRKADAPVTMRLSPAFAPGAPRLPGSIAVAPVQARGITGALRYAYIDAAAPGEIHQAATFFWEEPPPRVLERALVAGLQSAFATVSGPSVGVSAERRVVATLTRFEEVMAGGSARAVVAFDANVVKDGKLFQSASVCGSAPIDSAAATVRAQAFDRAIHDAVGRLVQTLATGDASTAAPC